MLDELGWLPLSQRRYEARPVLFYNNINCLTEVSFKDVLMDINRLHIVTYNCKNFTTDGDTFEFIKGLFKESQFLLLQELWLYESVFHNLLKLDNHCDFIATSSMNEYTQRVGRKYGGTAILWDAYVKGSITKICFDNKRICGLIFKRIKISLLIINVYMPCDKKLCQ